MRLTPPEEEVNAPSIHIRDAGLTFGREAIFSQLNLTLKAAEWTGLLGLSGVGKSSLLRMIAGLTTAHETLFGQIEADNGHPLSQQIAYMAQTDLLLPWLTVLDNALLGYHLRPPSVETPRAKARDKARELLAKVGLSKAIEWLPSQLSGGMRQRVALVRTLMENKPIVLMDEPFSALDAITRYKLQALAVELLAGKTVLFITHDPSEALRLAKDIYIMQGSPAVIKLITHLHTPAPRDLADPFLIEHQSLLYQTLTQAAGEHL